MRPSLDIPMELAEEGGLILDPLADGLDMSVELLGCCDEGGEDCSGRAAPYGPPDPYGTSFGVPCAAPPRLPYCPTKEESLLLIDSGESGGRCMVKRKVRAAAQGWYRRRASVSTMQSDEIRRVAESDRSNESVIRI